MITEKDLEIDSLKNANKEIGRILKEAAKIQGNTMS